MPTAVLCTGFDTATDDVVLAMREVVRSAGVHLPDRPPQRPHLTLAAARVPQDGLASIVTLAAALAARHGPFEVPFDEVGRFGRAGVVWLGPRVRVPLLDDLQRDADAALRDAGHERALGQRSEPAQWVAHCTLCTRVPKPLLRDVQQRVQQAYRPVTARVDAIAVILVGGRGDVAHLPLGAAA